MSDSNPAQSDTSIKIPIQIWYVVLISVSVILIFVQTGMPVWGIAFVTVVTLFMMFYKSETSVLIIFILAVSFKLFPRGVSPGINDAIYVDDFLFALGVGAFFVFSFRYIELEVKLSSRGLGEKQTGFERKNYLRVSRFGSVIFKYPVAIFVGMIALLVVPRINNSQRYLGLIPEGLRAVMLAWFITLVVVLIATVFSVMGWRKLTKCQADIFLRRVWAREAGKEQLAIEKYRAKKKNVFKE